MKLETGFDVGDQFIRRDGSSHDVAIIVYRSADNSIGYRLKGSRRIYNCAPITFTRNWKPLTTTRRNLQMPDLITPPTPDELCPHVQAGAEMTGGWVFAANDPPIAVGMCHNCVTWCREHLSTPTAWRDTTAITRSRVANSTGSNYN